MNRILLGAFGLLFCTLPTLTAQGSGAAVRKQGVLFRGDVDLLVGKVREASRGRGGVLGDSVLTTAKVLAAMGNCHRRYHASDGPVVRPSLEYLIKNRQQDGSFGDAAATTWTIDALAVMNPDAYGTEIQDARTWLAKKGGAKVAGFDATVTNVLDAVRKDVFPEQLAGDAPKLAQTWDAANSALPFGVAADALVQLVASQVANARLDRAQEQHGAASATFSPVQEKGFHWLFQQQKDGLFGLHGDADTALTGFGLVALQTKPKALRSTDEQAAIEKGLRWLLAQQREDGTFSERLANYTTCAATAALSRWDDPAVRPALQKAQRAILAFQNAEQNGYQESDRDYGSIGYGGAQRGDNSNLHFALQALRETGLPADADAFKKALVFLQRTQNLKSVNDFSGKVPDPDSKDGAILDATSGDDGGAGYYPGNSAAGYIVQPDGKSVPRSYGSMTYALLKSYTLAGLPGTDPRVQAAVRWVQQNWTLACNPGSDPALGEKARYQGLFYYYMVLAQALDLAGVETLQTTTALPPQPHGATERQATGAAVSWRSELKNHLAGLQQADGSWLNAKNSRWMEGETLLCTCYAMLALEHCR